MNKELKESDIKYLTDLSYRCQSKNTNYNDYCKLKIIIEKINKKILKKSNENIWNIHLMYKLSYSKPRFEDLGKVKASSYEDALEIAKETAHKFLYEIYEEKHIENWEVKIRP